MTTKAQATKEKYRIGSQKLKKFLNQKTQKKKSKKETQRIGENICKSYI